MIEQVPIANNVTDEPLTVQTGRVMVVKVTAKPEVAVAVKANGLAVSAVSGGWVKLIACGVPAVLVNVKLAVRPLAAAVTAYGPPTVAFAVIGALATPDAFVTTVMVTVPLLNTPDAPLPGAVNVTFTPDSALFPPSLTVTASAAANAVPAVVLCGVVPAIAVIEYAGMTQDPLVPGIGLGPLFITATSCWP